MIWAWFRESRIVQILIDKDDPVGTSRRGRKHRQRIRVLCQARRTGGNQFEQKNGGTR